MPANQQIEFLNCRFDSFTEEEALQQCVQWSQEQRESHLLLTVNVSILMMMRTDADLKAACEAGELVVADGMPVVWGTKLLGTPLAGRVSGCDLMQRILSDGAEHNLRVFFLGASEEVVATLIETVSREHPDLDIAGYRNGYFSEADYPEVLQQIRESQADVLFVGMPTPFKEVWCHRFRDELCTPAIVPVGGSFDVLAGFVTRAPRWMQRIGMEWFWRLAMEPRRMWKRYLVTNTTFLALFAGAFVKTWLRRLLPKHNSETESVCLTAPRREARGGSTARFPAGRG